MVDYTRAFESRACSHVLPKYVTFDSCAGEEHVGNGTSSFSHFLLNECDVSKAVIVPKN